MTKTDRARYGINWRIIGWGGAVTLLLVPFIAMRVGGTGFDWTLGDFVVAGVLFGVVGLAIELLVRQSSILSYRIGAVVAVFAGLFLIWINLAVGIIGSEEHDANMLYALVIAVAVGGAIVARLQAGGMALAMFAAALVAVLIALTAVAMGWGAETVNWPRDVLGATGINATMWLVSAALFRMAARAAAR
jgi:hypothetical protein